MTPGPVERKFADELQRAIRQFGDRTWTSQAMTDRILLLHEAAIAEAVKEALFDAFVQIARMKTMLRDGITSQEIERAEKRINDLHKALVREEIDKEVKAAVERCAKAVCPKCRGEMAAYHDPKCSVVRAQGATHG